MKLSCGLRAKTASAALTLVMATGLSMAPASAGPLPRLHFGPVIAVSACGTLNHPGNYQLTTNIAAVPGTCFVLAAPNVTLDLAGHTVAGTGVGAGIGIAPVASHARVESSVAGAIVSGFMNGVRDDGSYAVISGPGLTIAANKAAGVWAFHVTGSFVEHLVVTANHGYGIRAQLSGGVNISGNRVTTSAAYGIWDETSRGTQVLNNDVGGSGLAGIYLGCSGTGNLQDVACGRPSNKSQVRSNDLVSNGGYGVAIALESLGNIVTGNRASGDSANDLQDENFHCTGATGTNTWQGNTGTRNQTFSATCIG